MGREFIITAGYLLYTKQRVEIEVPDSDESERQLFCRVKRTDAILVPIKKDENETMGEFRKRLGRLAEKLLLTRSLP